MANYVNRLSTCLEDVPPESVPERAQSETAAGLRTFPTGFGQSDTHAKILHDGRENPSPTAGTPYGTIDAMAITGMLARPQRVPKAKAQWVIPSTYAGHDARASEAQRIHGQFWFLPIDIDDNDIPLEDVIAALNAVVPGASWVIYSSRSAKASDRRWRVFVWLKTPLAGEDYRDTQDAFFELLEAATAGVLRPCGGLLNPAQLVYLPNRGTHYEHHAERGQRLDLTDHPVTRLRDQRRVERAAAEREAQRRREQKARERAARASDDVQPIDHFNDRHTVEQLLGKYGYKHGGGNDWRSPMQSSGSYGTRDFGDFWVSLSTSDAATGIGAASKNGHRFGDAFDLFVHFEHGGKSPQAVQAYAMEAGLDGTQQQYAGGDDFDWRSEAQGKQSAQGKAEFEDDDIGESGADAAPLVFTPTIFTLRNNTSEIPPRQWLYGRHLIRGFVSTTVAPGGLGKSSHANVEGLAMVTGRALLGDLPTCQLRVWLWNGEDPTEELERRTAAACLHYGITAADIGDRLLIDSGRDVPIKVARVERQSLVIARPTTDALVAALLKAKIDVLIIDPFVASHDVTENDNTAMNAVIAEWRRVADAANCAIELIHHVSKAGAAMAEEMGVYASRGAGALIDGVRSARFLTRMKSDDGTKFGIVDPSAYFRVNAGKANLAPLADATWRRMVSVPLNNGRGLWQSGDYVGVCEAWTPPDAFEGMTLGDLAKVQDAIASCAESPKENERATGWVGEVIASALGLDIGAGKKAERTPAQNIARVKVRQLLGGWLRSNALVIETVRSSRDGRDLKVVVVGEPAFFDHPVD
jgi:hypothetical protein